MNGVDPTYIVVAVNAVIGILACILASIAAMLLNKVTKLLDRLVLLTESLVKQTARSDSVSR